jgi:hypothetical protein
MADHVFTAGDTVRLLRDLRSLKSQPEGLYQVVRAVPDEGQAPRYRIKHEEGAYECVVSASQLRRTERTDDDAA